VYRSEYGGKCDTASSTALALIKGWDLARDETLQYYPSSVS